MDLAALGTSFAEVGGSGNRSEILEFSRSQAREAGKNLKVMPLKSPPRLLIC